MAAAALHHGQISPLDASFCGIDTASPTHSLTWDLSTLSNATFALNSEYTVAAPMYAANAEGNSCADTLARGDPMLQECRGLGRLRYNTIITPIGLLGADGFNLTLNGGSSDPPCDAHGPNKGNRTAVYQFICDAAAPASSGPDATIGVVESPGCTYNVQWRHPAFCTPKVSTAACGSEPVPPPAKPAKCATCLPTWKPSYKMSQSTILYTCNDTGMHDVGHATKFGVVVYDWSNAKALWANAHPMNSEELLTEQCDRVLAASPSIPGEVPRCWVYRNTIKALNWYTSVREKLDNPKYSSWFIKFKNFTDAAYPGGQGLQENNTIGFYHVPACDWYGDAKSGPPKCSGFYHDQEQTPNHATPAGGSWPAYHVDGECIEQCDCGATNPCGEYIFDHRGGEVEGRTFSDWFIFEYMLTNETVEHKPFISLGWLDDSMKSSGPTEEDSHFQLDTNLSNETMTELVTAYEVSMARLEREVVKKGGFTWQMMKGNGPQVRNTSKHGSHPAKNVSTATCLKTLRKWCVSDGPSDWRYVQKYEIHAEIAVQEGESHTAEFLLTRGPYAFIGYGWIGCTQGNEARPFPMEWGREYGTPVAPCSETVPGKSGVFAREWTEANVEWDCNGAVGTIKMK